MATIKLLVVAGGGAGGYVSLNSSNAGGGGGAGEIVYNATNAVVAQAYGVTIGAGGVASTTVTNSGGNSVFGTVTALGGGYGGRGASSASGADPGGAGGSGGGGTYGGAGGAATGVLGNAGGAATTVNGASGSGGGAGVAGVIDTGPAGAIGGDGLAYSISGASVYYAGGGGGGGFSTGLGTPIAGGLGGGGTGTQGHHNAGGDGTANTGGGGGGAGGSGASLAASPGGNGGSGIVIISYATDGSDGVSNTSTGGTVTTSGTQTIHTFTVSGTFTVVLPPPTATITFTEDNDVVSAAGNTGLGASVAFTEDDDVVAAVGSVGFGASVAFTEDDDVVSSAGSVGLGASVAFTEDDDVVAAIGSTAPVGTIAFTEDDDVVSAAGNSGVTAATIAFTEDDDVVAAVGSVGLGATIAFTEDADVVSSAASINNIASVAFTEDDDTVAVAGSVPVIQTEPFAVTVFDRTTGVPKTGLTGLVLLSARDDATGYQFDFTDNQFRLVAAIKTHALLEYDSVNSAGYYRDSITTTTWNSSITIMVSYDDASGQPPKRWAASSVRYLNGVRLGFNNIAAGLASDERTKLLGLPSSIQNASSTRTNLAAELALIDAAVSSRSVYAGGAVSSVTAGVTVTTNNDKTGYGLSATAVLAIWDAATAALTTVGSVGKKLADWVVGTITTYTGNTPQTGDAFSRLGAPTGSSVSADLAAVKAETATILGAANNIQTRIPTLLVGGNMAIDTTNISTPAQIAAAVGLRAITATLTADQSQRVTNAILFGKVSGAGTGTETFRNPEDTKNVCIVTVDVNGNRSLVVLDAA